MGYKAYSDSYLMSLTKAQVIELLRTAEHDFFTTEEALKNSVKAGMEIAEKFDKAKELLKAAVEDMTEAADCGACLHDNDGKCPIEFKRCEFKWRYADEAKRLIKCVRWQV